jgi:hypothetical protein
LLLVVLFAKVSAPRAQNFGSVSLTTHVFATANGIVVRETPLTLAIGPASRGDAIIASLSGTPPGHAYTRADAFADWLPGAVKVSASARIDGLCLPLGNGGRDGRGTLRAAASAFAGTLTFTDPGIASDATAQNNLVLSGSVLRSATFISPETESFYKYGGVADATASFTYSIAQTRFNADAGRDVFVRLTGGSVQITSHFDGTTSIAASGFLQGNPAFVNGAMTLTTVPYQLVAGKEIEVQFSAQVDTGYQYSAHGADQVASGLGFANTFGFSTTLAAPAFASGTAICIPALSIAGGVYAPVPEPQAWLLVVFGFGPISAAARRPRRGAWPRPAVKS